MKRQLFFALFLLSQVFAFSQNLDWINEIDMDPYNYYPIQSKSTDVVVDNDGAIWSSFRYIGITKYYNNIYTVYNYDSLNLPASDITDLNIENGVLYAASDSGILKFNGTEWEVYLNQSLGLHSNSVRGMDIKNNIIYARTDTFLNIYNISAGTFSYVYLTNSSDDWNTVSIKKAVYVDDNENIYAAEDTSIYLINNDTITNIYYTNVLSFNIRDIKKTNSGQLYAVSSLYLFKLIGDTLVEMERYLNPIYSGIGFTYYPRSIFVDYDTIYVACSKRIIKLTINDDYKIYNFPRLNPPIFNEYFEGVIFKDVNNNFCIKNNYDYYKIIDLSLYVDVTSTTQDNYNHLDINYVNAGVKQNESMFWFNGQPKYEVPAGSGKHSNFVNNLWITAEDEYSLIYCAAGTYNANGFDFYPGPLNDYGETDSTTSYYYNKLWKLNRLDIEEMRYRYENGLITQPGYQIPEDILTWPANGDVSQGYSQNLAPYYDANGDNIYNVYDGDYPIIRGDQDIYSITNDNLSEHSETDGVPLKIEIHREFYAYSCSSATDSTDEINYTTFLHYKVINKSDKTYLNTKMGIYSDADIGDASNDLIGSNVDLKSYYFYNSGDDWDGDLNTYGVNPPALAYTFLKGPIADNADYKDNDNDGQIDEVGETCDFNYFLYFRNGGGAIVGDPYDALDYFYFMQSDWKDGSDQKYDTTNINANFAYSGNSDSNYFGTAGINPGFAWYDTDKGDKRGIGSMGKFTFEPDEEVEFDIAIVWSRDTTDTVDANNVQKLFRDIENIRYWYDNNIDVSCLELDTNSIGVSTVNQNVDFELYPNPVKYYLNIEYSDYRDANFRIVDLNGKLILEQELTAEKTQINTKYLSRGVYVITIYSKNATISKKFVK